MTIPVPPLVPEGPRAKRKPKAPKLGKCCKPMEVVLSRPLANEMGLFIGQAFSFKAGTSRDAMAYNFRKAKKGEPFPEIKGTFGWS